MVLDKMLERTKLAIAALHQIDDELKTTQDPDHCTDLLIQSLALLNELVGNYTVLKRIAATTHAKRSFAGWEDIYRRRVAKTLELLAPSAEAQAA